MPNWSDILQEIQTVQLNGQKEVAAQQQKIQNAINVVRHGYLKKLHERTGRNVIAYYSGFLSKPGIYGSEINDEDKNGFMMAVHKLDRSKGLDIILHTPGGGLTSTQSIVDYLHRMFRVNGGAPNVRAIVPQIAMSAGTMIACACREIWLGKHSNLGPIDPQFNGIPAYGVLREFKTACREVKKDPSKIPLWQSIIGQYRPTYLSRCENAIDLSNTFVATQLEKVMFHGEADAKKKAGKIVKSLSHYTDNKQHDRHIHYDECVSMGLKIKALEEATEYAAEVQEKGEFQDLVLTVHHCYMHLMMNTPALKIIENHLGIGIMKNVASHK